MARRTLSTLSGASIEEGLVSVFIRQIENADSARKEQLAAALRKGGTTRVKSSFPLSEDLRRMITEAVREQFSPEASVSWQLAPDMPLGVELDVDGYTLRWGVDQYLGELEGEISRAIAEAFGPDGGGTHA
jgi:hypothetical protein